LLFEEDGKSVEEIAAIEKVNVVQIQESLDYIKEWRYNNRLSLLTPKVISVLMREVEGMGDVFHRGMKATKVVHINKDTGKIKTVPDIAMQLKTTGEMRALIESVSPKTPLLQNNTQINNGMPGHSFSNGMSFEALLRRKREQRGLANDQEVDVIDAPQTREEEIADEFAEFGGDEGEDEEGDEDESPA
jgi:hypothetical protein